MLKKSIVMTALVLLVAAAPAMAQSKRVELGALFGWTFSDGVSSDGVRVDGITYNRIDPKDSFSFGLDLGVFVNEQVEVGFLFNMQPTKLQVGGTAPRDIGDMNVNTYHGYVAYHLGDDSYKVRPYFMFGMGATDFASVSYTKIVGGGAAKTQGATQFSTTWGAGVKAYPSANVGLRAGVQWTPTYIKSDPGGYWCDPYWGCYMTGNAQYSNQWTLNGGITFKF